LVVEIGRLAKEIESGLGKFCVGEEGMETVGGQFGRKSLKVGIKESGCR